MSARCCVACGSLLSCSTQTTNTHTDAAPLDAHYPTAPPAGRRPPRRSKPSPPSPHHARHVTGNTPISTTPRSPLSVIRYVPSPAMHVAHLSAPPPPALLSHFPLLSCTRAHKRQPHAAAAAAASRTQHTPEKLLSPSATPQHSTTSTFSSTHTTLFCAAFALSHPYSGALERAAQPL